MVAAAPQFVGGDDFAPAADGNLVDAGDPAASPTGVDLLGASRVLDGSGDGAARIDVGAIERAQPPVKVVSATFAGTLKLSRKKTKSAVRVLTSLPKSKRPVFAITLSRGAPVTMTVARRKSKGRFVTLPGRKVVTATGPKLLLTPTGTWNGRILRTGNYKATFSVPGGSSTVVNFRVRG